MRFVIKCGHLNSNSHAHANGQSWGGVKRSSLAIVPLGRWGWEKRKGRCVIGRRFYVYWRDGSCHNLDIILVFQKSPYRPPSEYAADPTWSYQP